MAFYQFIVYNNDGTVFAEQAITHSQEISYYLTGLNSGYHYKIELKCTSQSGMESSSGLIETEVVYFQPNMNSVLELYNTEDAMVELRAVLAQIQGEINEYVSYYPVNNPDWLDITDERGILIIDNGLSGITDNYTIILCLKDIKNGKRLFKLSCTNGNITVIYEDNIFKAFTEMNGVKALYMSDEFEAEKASRIKLAMFSQDSRIGFKVLECEKV